MNFYFDEDLTPSPMLVDPIYLSSDSDEEEMKVDVPSGTDADDEDSLSTEIELMSLNIEQQLLHSPIPIRPSYAEIMQTPTSTPTRRLFQNSDFDLNMARGWNERARSNHPIELCRNIVPVRDSPISPDTPNRRPEIFRPYDIPNQGASTSNMPARDQAVDLISGHLENVAVAESNVQEKFSHCLICGRPYEQIVDEAVIDYLHQTEQRGESMETKQANREAFLAGMTAGTFMFVPRGLSQAAACDGTLYTINTGTAIGRALPGTLPLL